MKISPFSMQVLTHKSWLKDLTLKIKALLQKLRNLLFFDEAQVSPFGGRFFPRFFTHSCFFAFRVLCALFFFFQLAGGQRSSIPPAAISILSVAVSLHALILLSLKRVSRRKTALRVEFLQTSLDIALGTSLAVLYPSCQLLALISFSLPITQASLLGYSRYWLLLSLITAIFGSVLVIKYPNIPALFSL
jgi:hypothetical protein